MPSVDALIRPVNPLVMALLRSRFHRVASGALLVVSWSGRSSGRRFSIPVGYQRDGDDVIVLLTRPEVKSWWKNFRSPWPADLLLAGRERTAMGSLIPPGSQALFALVEKTIRATPWMAKQFGIEGFDAARGLSPAERSIVEKTAAAIRFELTD